VVDRGVHRVQAWTKRDRGCRPPANSGNEGHCLGTRGAFCEGRCRWRPWIGDVISGFATGRHLRLGAISRGNQLGSVVVLQVDMNGTLRSSGHWSARAGERVRGPQAHASRCAGGWVWRFMVVVASRRNAVRTRKAGGPLRRQSQRDLHAAGTPIGSHGALGSPRDCPLPLDAPVQGRALKFVRTAHPAVLQTAGVACEGKHRQLQNHDVGAATQTRLFTLRSSAQAAQHSREIADVTCSRA